MHALPLTYNKDMQEDKEHLFDTVDTLELCLAAARGMLGGITFKRERLAAAATDEMLAAVDVADMLVKRGVPFRQSHGIVAGLVREAVTSGRTLSELTLEEIKQHADVLDDEFYSVLSQGSWLESKESEGGTKLDRVREQLAHARAALDSDVLKASFYDRPVLDVAPDLLGCVVTHGVDRGRDRRDRGLPLHRAGVPRPHRHHAAHARPARAARARPTSTAPTGSTPCSTPSASRRASARPC